jgi:hypothetical protein
MGCDGPMNWARGFFRLWIVLVALWVAWVVGIAFTEKAIPSWRQGCEQLREFVWEDTGPSLGDAGVEQCNRVWRAKRLEWAAWAFGPPLALLFGGATVGWIVRGFRRPVGA